MQKHTCTETIHKTEAGTAQYLRVVYQNAHGTIQNVSLTANPFGCQFPAISAPAGNEVSIAWPTPCVDQNEQVVYIFDVGYTCEIVQPPFIVEWSGVQYSSSKYPSLDAWVALGLALCVGAYLASLLVKRGKAIRT